MNGGHLDYAAFLFAWAWVSACSAYFDAAGGSGHEDGKSEYLRYETDSVELCGAKVQVSG
ncbi:hypothetical protein JCM18920_3405 [Cutibacterium acnes JCM 18920]|nr:hypothetical protein JCM18920_3405 [Cutibacterium acnes JCM 18920]